MNEERPKEHDVREALERWANEGRLSPERSERLATLVRSAARRETARRRWIWLPGPVAAVIALVWIFAVSPNWEVPWGSNDPVQVGGESGPSRPVTHTFMAENESVAVHVTETATGYAVQVELLPRHGEDSYPAEEHIPLRIPLSEGRVLEGEAYVHRDANGFVTIGVRTPEFFEQVTEWMADHVATELYVDQPKKNEG